MLVFFSSRLNWDPSLPQFAPPLWFRGGDTLAGGGGGGGGGGPNSDEGTDTVVL
jgi:hypothetical protein